MFQALFLISSAVSAAGSFAGAQGQAASAELNAFNIETQKTQNDANSFQAANDRYREFKLGESVNRALLAGSMGRDIGGADRSVAAFLERNRETAFRDLDRMESQRQAEALNYQMQAGSERRRAADLRGSAVVGVFTSAASTILNYQSIFMPTDSATSTALAPTTSPRPTVRPGG